jgi:hypothetical protein
MVIYHTLYHSRKLLILSHYVEGFKFALEIRCFIFFWVLLPLLTAERFCLATTNFSA